MLSSTSNPIKYTGKIAFSPDSYYFAVSKGLNLLIYDSDLLKPHKSFNFCDFIEDIQWSNNSKLILIGLYKRGIVELKSNESNNDWKCKIDEGVQGLSYARLSPDSKHILTYSNNNIKLTIRSLIDKTERYIKFPKFSRKGVTFTSNGNFMALAERKNARDLIGIYFLGNWSCITKFTPISEDLQDIKFSYDNANLIIIDIATNPKIYIYSPVGDIISVIEPYKEKLGFRNVIISPNGHYITAGLYDQTVRLYNHVSFTNITILDHSSDLLTDNKVNYFKEEYINEKTSKYTLLNPPVQLENSLPNSNTLLPDDPIKMGIRKMSYSYDSNFLATKNENMPNCVFIWETFGMNLHTVIIQLNNVIDFRWAETAHILFISTKNNKLYYFTLESCFCYELKEGFCLEGFSMSKDGKKLVLKDSQSFIICDLKNNNSLYYEEGKTSKTTKTNNTVKINSGNSGDFHNLGKLDGEMSSGLLNKKQSIEGISSSNKGLEQMGLENLEENLENGEENIEEHQEEEQIDEENNEEQVGQEDENNNDIQQNNENFQENEEEYEQVEVPDEQNFEEMEQGDEEQIIEDDGDVEIGN